MSICKYSVFIDVEIICMVLTVWRNAMARAEKMNLSPLLVFHLNLCYKLALDVGKKLNCNPSYPILMFPLNG